MLQPSIRKPQLNYQSIDNRPKCYGHCLVVPSNIHFEKGKPYTRKGNALKENAQFLQQYQAYPLVSNRKDPVSFHMPASNVRNVDVYNKKIKPVYNPVSSFA